MGDVLKQGELFIREVTARLTGDDAGTKAVRIAKKAFSALNSQLAALDSAQVDAEDVVEECEEALKDAKFPKEEIKDGKKYIQGIQDAQNALDKAQQELDNVIESIEYFKKLKASY